MKITVGESGTGGGFEKFCAGETDISNASRPIDDAEEVPLCERGGVTYEARLDLSHPFSEWLFSYVSIATGCWCQPARHRASMA